MIIVCLSSPYVPSVFSGKLWYGSSRLVPFDYYKWFPLLDNETLSTQTAQPSEEEESLINFNLIDKWCQIVTHISHISHSNWNYRFLDTVTSLCGSVKQSCEVNGVYVSRGQLKWIMKLVNMIWYHKSRNNLKSITHELSHQDTFWPC